MCTSDNCRIGNDCHSNFLHRLRSDGVNYAADFLSQAAGVSQFADGGIKVGECSGVLPPPAPSGCGIPPEFGGTPCTQPCIYVQSVVYLTRHILQAFRSSCQQVVCFCITAPTVKMHNTLVK